MYSLLDEIDKYIKENNIPFKKIVFHNSYLPEYINMAIFKEMQKTSHSLDIKIDNNYELRYDKNNQLYLLVHNDRNREFFAIGKENKRINEDFIMSGRTEKHIIKWGCLFKILNPEIKTLKKEINSKYMYLNKREKNNLEYELINDLLEDKYQEFVKNNKFIEDVVDYEEELIESTYALKYYIRYLFEYYNDNVKVKKRG